GIDYRVFDGVRSNPRIDDAESAAAVAKDAGSEVIVAIGGGSPIDAAKAAAVVAAGGDRLRECEGEGHLPVVPLPVVAVPTTAGSGSEVTGWSIVTDGDRKLGIFDCRLCPVLALADPQLTTSLPAGPTAWGGMDVLTHAVEAYLSRVANHYSDALASSAVRLVFASLERAVREPRDIEARRNMLQASIMSALAFSASGLGSVHAAAEAAGGVYDLPHGQLNGLLLPAVIRRLAPQVRGRLESLTRVIARDEGSLSGRIENLARRCGLSTKLDVLTEEEDVERLVAMAGRDQGLGPRPLRPGELRDIFREVLGGGRG
ncbi:MAG: iron-containing alcohol dehydrogenase family protein, partial [Clostridia bacterium]